MDKNKILIFRFFPFLPLFFKTQHSPKTPNSKLKYTKEYDFFKTKYQLQNDFKSCFYFRAVVLSDVKVLKSPVKEGGIPPLLASLGHTTQVGIIFRYLNMEIFPFHILFQIWCIVYTVQCTLYTTDTCCMMRINYYVKDRTSFIINKSVLHFLRVHESVN